MKNYINLSKSLSLSIVAALMIGAGALVLSSCEVELPAAGSVEDMTPPKADFSSSADNTNSKLLIFSNLSASSTDYIWDFGDGNTSYDKDPTNLYPAEGTYTVTLTASDKLGVTSITTKDVWLPYPRSMSHLYWNQDLKVFSLKMEQAMVGIHGELLQAHEMTDHLVWVMLSKLQVVLFRLVILELNYLQTTPDVVTS